MGLLLGAVLVSVGLIAVVCGVLYWVKVAGSSSRLARGGSGDDNDDSDERAWDRDGP